MDAWIERAHEILAEDLGDAWDWRACEILANGSV